MIVREYGGDYEKLNAAKRVLADDYETESEIDVDNLAQTVFEGDSTIQDRFRSSLKKKDSMKKKTKLHQILKKRYLANKSLLPIPALKSVSPWIS